MLQDYHLYHDSLNNKVLLSSNRQKQALFDKYIIAQIPGKYYSLDTACHSSFGLVATLYPTLNISRYLCDNIYLLLIIINNNYNIIKVAVRRKRETIQLPFNYIHTLFMNSFCGCSTILCACRTALNIHSCGIISAIMNQSQWVVLRYIFLSSNNRYNSEILNKRLLHVYLQNNEAIFSIAKHFVEKLSKKDDDIQPLWYRNRYKEKVFVVF